MSQRSIASHLTVPIDPLNPPPPISHSFASLRQTVFSTWQAFEAAEARLILLDKQVHSELLNYISLHQRATPQQVQARKNRLTIHMYEAPIAEAERYYREMEKGMGELEQAARKEAETVEGRATLEIDVGVMRDYLRTTRDIIDVARVQIEQARAGLEV